MRNEGNAHISLKGILRVGKQVDDVDRHHQRETRHQRALHGQMDARERVPGPEDRYQQQPEDADELDHAPSVRLTIQKPSKDLRTLPVTSFRNMARPTFE